jgi:P27 family predicted phage terminase small subunit
LKIYGSREVEKRGGEPVPTAGVPECPDWLDDGAKSCWAQVAPLLASQSCLTLIDGNALTRYCVMWSRWVQCEKFIQKYGSTYKLTDARNKLRITQFPECRIAASLADQLRRLEAEFGMSPSARSNIDTGAVATPKSRFEEYMASKFK